MTESEQELVHSEDVDLKSSNNHRLDLKDLNLREIIEAIIMGLMVAGAVLAVSYLYIDYGVMCYCGEDGVTSMWDMKPGEYSVLICGFGLTEEAALEAIRLAGENGDANVVVLSDGKPHVIGDQAKYTGIIIREWLRELGI